MPRRRPPSGFRHIDGERRLNGEWLDPEIRVMGDAVFVQLSRTKGFKRRVFTLVDLEDYERIIKVSNWAIQRGGYTHYARATCSKFLPNHHLRLHALVLKAKHNEIVDHDSGDGLDNRKQNLRICSHAENCRNARRRTFPGKTSRFKGVCWSKYEECWIARITVNGERHDLGRFENEELAALAYDKAAPEIHGEFARTNAEMKLFEMDDPFIPDCSRGADFDRVVRHSDIATSVLHLPRNIRNPLVKDAYFLHRLAKAS